MAVQWKKLAYADDVEPSLGNPDVDGTVLSSTTAGVRSWVARYVHPTTAGNKHVPTAGATSNVLIYGGSSGTAAWSAMTDAVHGTRGGGTQHAVATTSANGFMSADDKAIVDVNSNPNILIDGNFEYWDEGTSGATGIYGPTMWYMWGAWGRSTNVPDGSKYSVQLTRTSDYITASFFVPAYIGKQIAGNDITISWWAQNVANVSFTRCFIRSFDVEDVSSAMTTRHTGTSFTSIDGTWRKFTQTFTLHADCANGFALIIRLEHTSSLALDGRIAQVKLEPGTVATPFYQGPEERLKVHEYYWNTYGPHAAPGTASIGGNSLVHNTNGVASRWLNMVTVNFATTMRANPTLTCYSPDTGAAGKVVISVDGDVDAGFFRVGNDRVMLLKNTDFAAAVRRIYAHVVADARFYP